MGTYVPLGTYVPTWTLDTSPKHKYDVIFKTQVYIFQSRSYIWPNVELILRTHLHCIHQSHHANRSPVFAGSSNDGTVREI